MSLIWETVLNQFVYAIESEISGFLPDAHPSSILNRHTKDLPDKSVLQSDSVSQSCFASIVFGMSLH